MKRGRVKKRPLLLKEVNRSSPQCNQFGKSLFAEFVGILNREDGDILLTFRPAIRLFTRGEEEYLASEVAPEFFQLALILLVRVKGDDGDNRTLRAVLFHFVRADGEGYLLFGNGRFGDDIRRLPQTLRQKKGIPGAPCPQFVPVYNKTVRPCPAL